MCVVFFLHIKKKKEIFHHTSDEAKSKTWNGCRVAQKQDRAVFTAVRLGLLVCWKKPLPFGKTVCTLEPARIISPDNGRTLHPFSNRTFFKAARCLPWLGSPPHCAGGTPCLLCTLAWLSHSSFCGSCCCCVHLPIESATPSEKYG